MKRVALTIFLAALYLPALGRSSSGTHPDEAYYLGISADMDAQGAWLTPTIDGSPRWFKPPLLYWAERIAYGVFGRGFFAGRLPAAISAIALALLTGALARRMYGERAETLAALLVGSTFGWLKFGRIAMMDAPMALAFTTAAYGAWRASEEDRPRQLLWAGVGAGTAFMLKGPVGVVIVLLLAGGFLALRRPALLRSRWTAGAFAVGALIGLPWYLASWAVHGREFLDFFLVEQNVDRFRHPWTWHGEALLLAGWLVFLLPWTPLVLAATPRPGRWREPQLLLPMVWTAAVLVLFSIPSLKWPHYGLACAPAGALLVSGGTAPRWARSATALLLALGAALAWAIPRWPIPPIALGALIATGGALLTAGWLVWRARLVAGAVMAGIGLAVTIAFAIPSINPPIIPPAQLARLAGRDIYVYDFVPGLFTLDAGRTVHRIDRESVARVAEQGGVVILTGEALETMPPGVRERLAPVARWQRIRGEVPVSTLLRAWRDRDTAPLFEPMLAIGLGSSARR